MNKKGWQEFFKSLLQSLVIVIMFNWLVGHLSVIPSGSMIPTIQEGDVVIVNKLAYGAKTPQTLLHLPFTQDKIPILNIPSYLTWIKLPTYSLPGFSKPKRGDCVVIRRPKRAAVCPAYNDVEVNYCKRLIAVCGDRYATIHGEDYVNGKRLKEFNAYQHRYLIKTAERLPRSFFDKYGIKDYSYTREGYVEVYLSKVKADKIKNIGAIQDVIRVIVAPGKDTGARFAQLAGGSEDHIPEFIIPYKGMVIDLTCKRNVDLYGDIIMDYELDSEADKQMVNHEIFVHGKRLKKITITYNYFYVRGDNRDRSYDSGYFGLVPEIYLLGRVERVALRVKNPDLPVIVNLLLFNIDWKRIGKIIK